MRGVREWWTNRANQRFQTKVIRGQIPSDQVARCGHEYCGNFVPVGQVECEPCHLMTKEVSNG
jgi:hypothetical protein